MVAVKTSLMPCLVTLSEGYSTGGLLGLLWGGFRREPGRAYLSGVSWGGEPGNFKISIRVVIRLHTVV